MSYSSQTDELKESVEVKEDKEYARKVFSIIAGVSAAGLVSLIIIGLVLRGRDGGNGEEPGVGGNGGESGETPIKAAGSKTETAPPPPPPPPPKPFSMTVDKGKSYSGEALIDLYKNLPENSIINCNLEVEGRFEECTVMSSPLVNLDETGQLTELGKVITPILTERNHVLAKCCRDTAKNTVLFTTMPKVPGLEPEFNGVDVKDCLETPWCTDHVKAKIARNQLYQKFTDTKFVGCTIKAPGEAGVEVEGIKSIFKVLEGNDSKKELQLKCPEGFEFSAQIIESYAMLYRFTLTSPHHKLAGVKFFGNPVQLWLYTTYNWHAEGAEAVTLNGIITHLDKITTGHATKA